MLPRLPVSTYSTFPLLSVPSYSLCLSKSEDDLLTTFVRFLAQAVHLVRLPRPCTPGISQKNPHGFISYPAIRVTANHKPSPFSIVIPCLIIASANTWVQWNEHWEHQSHLPPISERPQYAYMNIRSKAYPWGDGDKVCFDLYSSFICPSSSFSFFSTRA